MLCDLAYMKNVSTTDFDYTNHLNYPVNWETGKVCNRLHSFQVSSYHSSFVPLRIEWFFSCLHSMLKDGLSKDGSKTLRMDVTLKAVVRHDV